MKGININTITTLMGKLVSTNSKTFNFYIYHFNPIFIFSMLSINELNSLKKTNIRTIGTIKAASIVLKKQIQLKECLKSRPQFKK